MSNQVLVPRTIDQIIFINLNSNLNDSSFYTPSLTGGRVTQEEVDQVLRRIKEIIKPVNRRMLIILGLHILGAIALILLTILNILSGIGSIIGILAVIIIFFTYMFVILRAQETRVQDLFHEINPEFVPRGLRWRLSDYFPKSTTTKHTIVFRFRFKVEAYDSSFYTPSLTDGHVTQEEANQVLRRIEEIVKPYSRKFSYAARLYYLGSIAVVILVVLDILPIIVGIIGIIAINITLFIHTNDLWKIKETPIQSLIHEINQEFTLRGLRWHCQGHFPTRIELWKDYLDFAPAGDSTHIPSQQQQHQGYEILNDMPDSQPRAHQDDEAQPLNFQDYTLNYNQQNYRNYYPNPAA